MPIEELLALYNCVTPSVQKLSSNGSRKRSSRTSRNALVEKIVMAPPPETPKTSETKTAEDQTKDAKEDEPPANKKLKLHPPESSLIKEKSEQQDENSSNVTNENTSVETVSKSTNDDTKKLETKPKSSDSLCSVDKESSANKESDAEDEMDDGTKENSLNKGNTSKKTNDIPVEGEKTT